MSFTARLEVRVFAAVDRKELGIEPHEAMRNWITREITVFRCLPNVLGELDVDVELKEVVDHGNTKDER